MKTRRGGGGGVSAKAWGGEGADGSGVQCQVPPFLIAKRTWATSQPLNSTSLSLFPCMRSGYMIVFVGLSWGESKYWSFIEQTGDRAKNKAWSPALRPHYPERGRKCLAQGRAWHKVNLFLYPSSRIDRGINLGVGT